MPFKTSKLHHGIKGCRVLAGVGPLLSWEDSEGSTQLGVWTHESHFSGGQLEIMSVVRHNTSVGSILFPWLPESMREGGFS